MDVKRCIVIPKQKEDHPMDDLLFVGDPPEIRTPDTLLKRQVLCRLS